MANESSLPDVSVVIEWENTQNTTEPRTRLMLRTLGEQILEDARDLNRSFELILTHDPGVAGEDSIRGFLQAEVPDVLEIAPLRFVAVPGGSYYVLKNAAALQAKGEILTFIDCDVLPEPGWLRNILAPFDDSNVAVSQGATYVHPNGLLTLGLALAWLFPLKRSSGELTEKNRIIANNVAFRRGVFLASFLIPIFRRGEGSVLSNESSSMHTVPEFTGQAMRAPFIRFRKGLLPR